MVHNKVCYTQWPYHSFNINNGYCIINWSYLGGGGEGGKKIYFNVHHHVIVKDNLS